MKKLALAVLALAWVAALAITADGQTPAEGDGPRYANKVNLVRPARLPRMGVRQLGPGHGVQPGRWATGAQSFGNVFVNPSSYRAFMKTGKWPDRTTFVLEFRASTGEGSINKAGRFQSRLVGLEAEVKDSRFPDGWAFFNFSQKGSDFEQRRTAAGQRRLRRVPHQEHRGRADLRPVLSDADGGGPEDGHRQVRVLGRFRSITPPKLSNLE